MLFKYIIFLILNITIVFGREWAFVGNPLLQAHPCKNNTQITLSYEGGQPPEEENKYNLFIHEDLPSHSRIIIKFDHGARVTEWAFVGNPLLHARPCKNNTKITLSYESGQPPEEENKYNLFIDEDLPSHSKIIIKFDHGARVKLSQSDYGRISSYGNEFIIRMFKPKNGIGMEVKGTTKSVISYPTSININTEENCENPDIGVIDNVIQGVRDTAESDLKIDSGPECGRRKVTHTELITNSVPTKPGDWPWHAALYRFDKSTLKYICGGTLISKNIVLTAAHCTTIRGVAVSPEVLNVILGKYNLVGGDIATQDREVFQVIVHEEYVASTLNHDISLLKLKSEATYNDYVQPACIWNKEAYEKLHGGSIFGTVVGWGFDQTDQLSTELHQATMPKVSDSTCLKSNAVFFGKMLTNYKFCAGYKNGTSACNGDSGGGFMVFIPNVANEDTPDDTPMGSYYIRGIVSVGVSRANVAICDPHQYVLFTDVSKYRSWIDKNIV